MPGGLLAVSPQAPTSPGAAKVVGGRGAAPVSAGRTAETPASVIEATSGLAAGGVGTSQAGGGSVPADTKPALPHGSAAIDPSVAAPLVLGAGIPAHVPAVSLEGAKIASGVPQEHSEATQVKLPTSSVSGVEVPEARMLVASPKVLEVGIDGGTNGWLRVRAEMGGSGEISASVIAHTAGAVEALHRELPALSAYLQHEQVGVNSVAVSRGEATVPGQNAAMSSGAGGEAGRERQNGGTMSSQTTFSSDDPEETRSGRILPDFTSASPPAIAYGVQSGGWLNVVA